MKETVKAEDMGASEEKKILWGGDPEESFQVPHHVSGPSLAGTVHVGQPFPKERLTRERK